jgi:aryl-alcohol dehydrogenase-like predicted oxidoreductase/enamine deaminase RidA (YjgF/YER057c/UK114 family)
MREIALGIAVPPVLVGLWQMADQERDGRRLDLDRAAEALADYARAGFTAWDMADHYGSAEIVAGRAARILAAESGPRPVILTKWCPEPGPMPRATVRAGVMRALDRLGLARVDVMQFHWWVYEHLAWLDALEELARLREEGLIGAIGLTNFDAAHLRLVVRQGIPVATNQVCFSLLDRRAAGDMAAAAAATGARLLAFGTLAGGFLTARWLGAAAPADIADWSKMKYGRFIAAAGGWARFQTLLGVLDGVARRHGASIANVATRWVLDHAPVAGVIVGARLGEREHRADTLGLLSLALDDADRAAIGAATAALDPIPGDCGDEYRKPPFLTASGDLSHHLAQVPRLFAAVPVPGRPGRSRVDSGSVWEAKAGFSRALRSGRRILVSGTTATDPHGRPVAAGDAGAQATYILDKIAAALAPLGATLEDVVRTRIYLSDPADWEAVAAAHARAFAPVRPANTMTGAALIGPYLVEIEAEAELMPGPRAEPAPPARPPDLPPAP